MRFKVQSAVRRVADAVVISFTGPLCGRHRPQTWCKGLSGTAEGAAASHVRPCPLKAVLTRGRHTTYVSTRATHVLLPGVIRAWLALNNENLRGCALYISALQYATYNI